MEDFKNRYRARRTPPPLETNIPMRLIWTILAINALVSLVVSLLVVLVMGPWLYGNPTPAAPSQTVAATTESPAGVQLPPTPTATATPAEPVPYIVQAGDTLGLIAEKFGVGTDALMEANGLTNPNLIREGQKLIIPVPNGSALIATPTPKPSTGASEETTNPRPKQFVVPPADISLTPTPTVTPPPTATAPPLGQVLVSITRVMGYGNAEDELVTLSNTGAGISLAGWTLEGSRLGTYNFPNMFLFSGGYIDLHTVAGIDSSSDIYWGQTEAAWQSGDTLILKDNKGNIVSSYIIP